MESLQPNQGNSEKAGFEILDEDLYGKTEAELTPEEREAEQRFCKENFKKFLDWMNNDGIFVHCVSGAREKGVLKSVLEKGILSAEQLNKKGMMDHGYDRPYQGSGWGKARRIIDSFLEINKKFEDNIIDDEEYEKEKDKILENVREIGKTRIAHFLNKVIPRIIKEVGYPVKPYVPNMMPDKINERQDFFKLYSKSVKGHASTGLGIRNILTKRDFNVSPENTPEEYKNIEIWDSLPNVMSGKEMVSSSSSRYMKENFINQKGFFMPVMSITDVQIYFKAPNELRQYEQGATGSKENGHDIGISNRVHPQSFRVMRFGIYDSELRVLSLDKEEGVTLNEIPLISQLQEKGLILIDDSLTPVPLLKSIRISETSMNFRLPGFHNVGGLSHPVENSEEIESVREEIKEGEIGMSLEEFEESLKNNHLLNVMLSNQQKSLATIEEMGGIKYEKNKENGE